MNDDTMICGFPGCKNEVENPYFPVCIHHENDVQSVAVKRIGRAQIVFSHSFEVPPLAYLDTVEPLGV